MHTLHPKNNGSVIINNEQYQVGSFDAIKYSGDEVTIIPNYGGITYSGLYSDFKNASTGLSFDSLAALKTFISVNFFDEATDGGVSEQQLKDEVSAAGAFQITGSVRAEIKSEPLRFFDSLQRNTQTAVPSGSRLSIFDNNTSYGPLFTPGSFSMDSSGLTKTSVTNSSILMFPETMNGDIDVEFDVRSIYLINPTPNFPPDSGAGTILRMQDEQNYCIVQVNNQHTLGCSLTIRECENGEEKVIGTYSNIYVSETAPKMSNTWPSIRVILRGDRVTVSLNGIRVLNEIALQKLKWGRHGLRIYKQGTLIRNLKIRENKPKKYPAIHVSKRQLLYGDGNRYVGWADCATLNDGSVFIVWRESPLNTPEGGHEVAGSIMCAKWKNGVMTAPVVLYAADGITVDDLQEQDCVLSKVYYNGRDQLILFTRKYRKIGGLNTTYVSTCDIGLYDPTDTTKWSERQQVSFPSQLTITAPHAKVLMDKENKGFITAFYGTRAGAAQGAIIMASSADMITWAFKSFAIDPISEVNPVPGGDFEPAIMRGNGASLLLYGRARTVISHDDGQTWCQYDMVGGNANRTRAFASCLRIDAGGILMHRRFTNSATPADTVLIPIQVNDGITYESSDFLNGAVIEQQFNGISLPGKANPGGDSGCPRAAAIGDNQYLLLNYMQKTEEMAPRLYMYILRTSSTQ